MDFAKFLTLLEYQVLFFPRARLLGDPFEGSAPKRTKLAEFAFAKSLEEDTGKPQIHGVVSTMELMRRKMVNNSS